MKKTQNDMVLEHLLLKGTITPLDALVEYGCFRDILVYIEQDKEGYKKLLNAAISCGVKTFEQFYEEHLKQFDRLN